MESISKENIRPIEHIIFFNHFHNGDIFISKSFIDSAIKSIPLKFSYLQRNHPILISDLNLVPIEFNVQGLNQNVAYGISECGKYLFINVWIGIYHRTTEIENPGCNLRTAHYMYKKISEIIYKHTNYKWTLSDDLTNYYPTVPLHTEKNNINKFVQDNKNKPMVLFCNGPTFSGQSKYNGDMQFEITSIAKTFRNILFITSQQINTTEENVISTSQIIKADRCDLNEISYLSTFCDLIVGRNSGPYTFSCVKQNMMDETKTFISFHCNEKDDLDYSTPHKCKKLYIKDDIPFQDIFNIIIKEIQKLR
jgi:hypothetical protein